MRRLTALFTGLLLSLALVAASADGSGPDTAGLNLDWLDKSVNPAQDFYTFANGGWQKANPVPDEYARWGTFNILTRHNQEVLRQILEDDAKGKHKHGSLAQKLGDFYATGMDEKAIEATGIKPLQAELDAIGAIQDQAALQKAVAHLQTIGVDALFAFGAGQDYKDSSRVIGIAGQGGLGLPDRDYYLKSVDQCAMPAVTASSATAAAPSAIDPSAQKEYDNCKAQAGKFQQVRDAYHTHVSKMLQLLGDPTDKADAEARSILQIETGLAKASLSRVERRDPDKIYHPMTLTELSALTPHFSWQAYFASVGRPELTGINMSTPDFFKALDADLITVSLDDWKTYLRWHTVDAFAAYLSKPFVDEDFQMNAALTGAKQLQPRWQRVVASEDNALGFALGKAYVEKEFPPSSKQAVVDILHAIRASLRDDLETLAWMSPETRKAAIDKLDFMQERIGYPDKWRDYSALDTQRDSYVQNVIRANVFEQQRQLAKIGKPVDLSEWLQTPPTVNAYYYAPQNNINFPAGILQPPFFDPKAPAAVNFGALGFVMGHEMTHGFDDRGSQFDGHGNLRNWWTPDDLAKFHKATDCISDYMSTYTVDGGLHVQGHLVTGEATADLGGLTLAWRAFHASKAYKTAKTIDGLTPDQQFFLGAAHVWAMNIRPEESRRLVTLDPHPPGVARVNYTMANMPQFQQTYHVPDGSPMVKKDRCEIW
ncbi:MAG TPA: M13 family metallopeptidase [Gammaproteobacteria bacterium]|nr:M13 family metallopeptidase [Gammaproteobacteria bacterium]